MIIDESKEQLVHKDNAATHELVPKLNSCGDELIFSKKELNGLQNKLLLLENANS